MKNVLGDNLTITLFGESHSDYIGAVIDGLPGGILIDNDYIKMMLKKRRPQGKIETSRVEEDHYQIISGIFNGYSTGAPLTIIIPNENVRSKDYSDIMNHPRPSHADYTAYVKYNGYNDYRGGGHFSGRLTAAIVACGSIIQKALENKGIYITTHIKELSGIKDIPFVGTKEEYDIITNKEFPVLTDVDDIMIKKITEYALDKDSIGGLIETSIINLPVGLGDPWFSSVEGKLANAMFSIGGIKGVNFGSFMDNYDKAASSMNDEFKIVNGTVCTNTNNNGGINGGITNGMPVIFTSIVKPTPSISKIQNTVNLDNMTDDKLEIKGRHDPAIIRRICPVVTSLTAIVMADLLVTKYGADYLK